MLPNLCVINISEKTYSIPIFDLKRPRKDPHYTAYKLVQEITPITSLVHLWKENNHSLSLH